MIVDRRRRHDQEGVAARELLVSGDGLERLHTVNHGHHHIEEHNHATGRGAQDIERLPPIVRQLNRVSLAGEQFTDEFPNIAIVINDQHAGPRVVPCDVCRSAPHIQTIIELPQCAVMWGRERVELGKRAP